MRRVPTTEDTGIERAAFWRAASGLWLALALLVEELSMRGLFLILGAEGDDERKVMTH